MLISLLKLTDAIISLYFWTLLAYVASSWLIALRIINPYQPLVRQVLQGLSALHEPILQPIRVWQYRLIPNMGGFDLSPVVALMAAEFIIGPLIKTVLINLLG